MTGPEADGFDRRVAELSGLEEIRLAAAGVSCFLVGGAVRDLWLDRERSDLDVAVEGDPAAIAASLGGAVRSHPRFGTVSVEVGGQVFDLAMTRSESYERPGALPTVRPAGIAEDLDRRDFTINAMAVPLSGGELLDPHGGRADLDAGALRVLHPDSFIDDPTRALRAARYAARFGFELEPETAKLLQRADLGTVSAERREAELKKLASEPAAVRGFELLGEWGLLALTPGRSALLRAIDDLAGRGPWVGFADRSEALLAGARDEPGAELESLLSSSPGSPSEAVALAHGRSATDLMLARASGAEWLDEYVARWRLVRLDISGEDLLEAGVEEGPAIGAGLAAALRAKLDGEVAGRAEELDRALGAAR